MKHNITQILKWTGVSEGGYVNDPVDPGGATNRGVTWRTYDAWRVGKGLPKQDVRKITDREVVQIFTAQYFDLVKGGELPDGLDYSATDFAIHSGPSRASKELQTVLGVSADGVIGAQTLAALEGRDIEQVILAYGERRMAFMKRLKVWWKYKNGWTARVEGKKWGFQVDDIGVVDRSVMLSRRHSDIPAPVPLADHPLAKAVGPDSLTATLSDALTSPQALGTAGSVIGSVATMASGSGPVQYAVAAVLVLGAVAGIIYMMRRPT